jgi:hypothetical protein
MKKSGLIRRMASLEGDKIETIITNFGKGMVCG